MGVLIHVPVDILGQHRAFSDGWVHSENGENEAGQPDKLRCLVRAELVRLPRQVDSRANLIGRHQRCHPLDEACDQPCHRTRQIMQLFRIPTANPEPSGFRFT